jgi:hypothetical protein
VARAATTPCDIAAVLAAVGEQAAARQTLRAALLRDPTLKCATDALERMAKEKRAKTARASTASLQVQCARARSVADAGAKEEAAEIYAEILKKQTLACATKGLANAKSKSWSYDLQNWLTHWTSLFGLLVGFAVFPLLVAALVFVWLTRRSEGARLWMGQQWLLSPLFRTRLTLQPFTDGGNDAGIGAGFTALLRARLSELSEPPAGDGAFVLDHLAGTEDLSQTIGDLAAISDQLKGVSAVFAFALAHSRVPRYTMNGTLQGAGTLGAGVTLVLSEQQAQEDIVTLWSHDTSGQDGPREYQAMAAGAAAWTDYRIRKHRGVETPSVTDNEASYAYLHVGLQLVRDGEVIRAMQAYWHAFAEAPDNVAALLNLSVLDAQQLQNYDRSLRWLTVAKQVIEAGQ